MNDRMERFEDENLQDLQEEMQSLLEEEFDPDRFYKALSNALVQLQHFSTEPAASNAA